MSRIASVWGLVLALGSLGATPLAAQDEREELRRSGTQTVPGAISSTNAAPAGTPRAGDTGVESFEQMGLEAGADAEATRRLPKEEERRATVELPPGSVPATVQGKPAADLWQQAVGSVRFLIALVTRNEPADDSQVRQGVEELTRLLEAAAEGQLAARHPELTRDVGALAEPVKAYLGADSTPLRWYQPSLYGALWTRWRSKSAILAKLNAIALAVDAQRTGGRTSTLAARALSIPGQARFTSAIGHGVAAGTLPLVTLRSPSGKTQQVRAYPHSGGFAVKVMATEPGRWTAEAANGEKMDVDVTGPAGRVVRVDKERPRVFTRADGRVIVPVGMNLGWLLEGNDVAKRLEAWTRYFDKMAAAGMNWTRVWCCPWGHWLESEKTGAGRYDEAAASSLDAVLELAARRGIYVQLVTEYHGILRPKHDWGRNPYNAARGGPCKTPTDFFTDEKAKQLYRRRLDYLVARYGAHENLFAWEFWNEVDLTLVHNPPAVIGWHREMTEYVRRIDPYRHMITTSTAGRGVLYAPLWTLAPFDFVQCHIYKHDLAHTLPEAMELLRRYGKPAIAGEAGQDSAWEPYIWETKFDPAGIGLHDSLFGGLLGGASGTGMFWWWDKYIDVDDRYRQYPPAVKVAQLIEAGAGLLQPVKADADGRGSSQVRVRALGSPKRLLVWVKDKEYVPTEKKPTPDSRKLGPFTIDVEVDEAAAWRITRIDSWTGAESAAGSAKSSGRKLKLRLEPFERDVVLLADRD